MAQVKIYGLNTHLIPIRSKMSDVIHSCAVEALGLPADKRFHRFSPLNEEDFVYPTPRSQAYTVIEVLLMRGRTQTTRKQFVRNLFFNFETELGIAPLDLEVCLIESDPENWGFRGQHGDEAILNYSIKV